jgi:hypothetical protein
MHTSQTAAMPPKRKASSSSPPSILVTSPTTPTSVELADGMLSKYTVTTEMDSSPLMSKSKQTEEAETPAIEEEEEIIEKNEMHTPGPDAPDDSATEQTSAKQGTAEKKKKTTPALKRKATPTNDDTPEPAAKKQKAPPKKRAAPRKIGAASKRRPKKGEEDDTSEPPPPPLPPLTLTIKRKLQAVDEFFDAHPKRLLESEAGSYVVEVDELDLLAALVILRVEYQLVYTVAADVSYEDVDEMIVSPGQTGEVSVDFNKRCDIERAAQATFAGRQTGLEDVNLLEVEVDMLVAKRKQLAKDGDPEAGFRVYEVDAAEEDGLPATSTIEEEDQVEEHVNTFEEDTIEILNAVADEEEIVDEIEKEAFEEQNDVDDESEASEEE